jgi:DNA-binding CsgD family transcriptional regulator
MTVADDALAEGRWADARAGFENVLSSTESAEACFGLAMALWWLGENQASVEVCGRAFSLFRRSGDVAGASRCAVWMAITYKANFGDFAVANGWLGRAERILAPIEPGPLHGWLWIARAYRAEDLEAAESLARRAVEVGRNAGDVDLELAGLSQLGLILVGKGATSDGFDLIDESVAATLFGERSRLDTVVYVCCDMLNACELAHDIERAAQWCKVADDFVETYGCPFLYAECRIFYGSVLTAKGRWNEAERELGVGVRITEGACPGLHRRALIRMAGLRIRQGRLEEADLQLTHLGEGVQSAAEEALSVATLLLARGDADGARRNLEQRLQQLEAHSSLLTVALDVLVDAQLAIGAVDEANAAAQRLRQVSSSTRAASHRAMAAHALGRVALARGDDEAAAARLEASLEEWSRLGLPFEGARARADLARALAVKQPDVAVDHARHALATFESLGAALEADRVAAHLRALGVTARVGVKNVGLLTFREQDVLRLLGAGLSNPEIAERLHVSRKTASHHVSNILAKLHLRNRAEAAVYAARVLGEAPLASDQR